MIRRLIILLLIVGCDIIDPPKEGCMDSDALNYDLNAEKDDGSCEYDTTPPTISSLSIDSWNCNYLDVCTQEYSWTSFDFSASVSDYGSGVDYVEAWIDWQSLYKDYYSPYDWTWYPTLASEGYKTFKVRAYDESGNYSEATKTFYYIVDFLYKIMDFLSVLYLYVILVL